MKKLRVGKSDIEGNGIFADEPIKKGDHICFIKGKTVHKKNTNRKQSQSIPLWYGLTEEDWIDPTGTIFIYFNHSCEPNTAIVGTKKVIALKNIRKGEEITFDYSMTDGDTLWSMECRCNTPSCRKEIVSIQRIPQHVYDQHLPFIPKYFKKLRQSNQ